MSEYDHLPEAYVADDGRRVTGPVYRLLADCFFGRAGAASRWEEGTEMETDFCPNDHMQPLNRAAARRIEQWRASLPVVAGRLSDDEIAEAAKLLAPREGEPIVPHEIWWPGVIRLAGELKAKRGGRTFIQPDTAAHVLSGRNAPPMTAGDFKDVSHRDDIARAGGVIPQSQLPGRRVKPSRPVMTANPKPPADNAVGQD